MAATKGKRIALFAGSFAALGLGLGLWLWPGPASTAEAARQGLNATFDGDVRSVASFIDPAETQGLNLTEEGVERVFKRYVVPSLSKGKRLGTANVETNAPTGAADASIDFVLPDGSRRPFIVSANLTPQGPRYDGFVSQAVLTAVVARHDRGDEPDKRKHVLSSLRQEIPTLRNLGVNGVFSGGKLWTWDDFVQDLERRIESHPQSPLR